MHVGFYLDTAHLNNWDWDDLLKGKLPLSGTDSTTLRLAHELASASSLDITLLTTVSGTSPSATPASQVEVANFTEAVRYAARYHFDVLVFNNACQSDLTKGVRLAETLQQPCIVWCHNGPWRRMAQLYAETDAIRRVLCVSHPHANLFREKKIFHKIEVVYNGINTSKYEVSTRSNRTSQSVCYVGALTESQGFHHLIKAWPQIRSSIPEAQLTVVGSPRLYDRNAELGPLGVAAPKYERSSIIPHIGSSLEEAKDQLGVKFMGLLSPNQTRAVMQSSSIGVVNPNTERGALETFCVTAVEMQAAETAVVGGRRRGLRETVRNGKTGVLINGPTQLAPTLQRLLDKPEQTRRMGTRGQEWVSKMFDLSHVVTRWEDILYATAQGQPPEPPPFSFRHTTPKTILRESIRRFHSLLGRGNRFPFVDRLINVIRRSQ